jgi:hypothetical protein
MRDPTNKKSPKVTLSQDKVMPLEGVLPKQHFSNLSLNAGWMAGSDFYHDGMHQPQPD